jgi:hypothetical protein
MAQSSFIRSFILNSKSGYYYQSDYHEVQRTPLTTIRMLGRIAQAAEYHLLRVGLRLDRVDAECLPEQIINLIGFF